jgi:phosphate starvation-inducible PhoH-like protein
MARKRSSNAPSAFDLDCPIKPVKAPPRRSQVILSKWQEEAAKVIQEHDMVILQGSAGCGKSFIALYEGIRRIRAGEFEKLVIIRSPLEAGRSRLGFLPGAATATEKMAPWCAPMLAIAKELRYSDEITVIPTGYIQGLTLSNCFAICTEAQNLDLSEWEGVTTRLGDDSKLVMEGDFRQDTRRMNGMLPFIEATKDISEIGYYDFPEDACQRSPIVRKITQALRKYRGD